MSSLADHLAADRRRAVAAVLGPTNTGKTHLALERMLRHRTGMIGLPLRLLAREVYDRLCIQAGREAVALVTGEEKIVPSTARYFVCTVEAMPVDRPVHFLAVDEIQLAAHRTRGHVFTDRLLHARGVFETLFLGAATMQPIIERLIPGVEVIRQPRLSRLTHVGHHKLHRLPPRSAVVAFSADQVYAHAERLRARHGGVAVVLGALSPRTRNAQVDLYQSGEVPYLVATDAIGMGLNMDVAHVAFAGTRKFDGRSGRHLEDDELAQIAGRAGRFRQDGTFGTTHECPPLEPDTVETIEQHRFPPVRRLWWRNPDLDFDGGTALLHSLEREPPRGELRRMGDAEDHRTLDGLLRLPAVQRATTDEASLRLLWDVAQVPDYRKTLTGHHVELLAELHGHLVDQGVLPAGWVEERLERLDRTEGDLDAIMARIAYVRTWTYVAFRGGWLQDQAATQERTRAIEDRLSDALHERLTARFVDHRVLVPGGPGGAGLPSVTVLDDGFLSIGGQTRGRIEGLDVRLDDAPPGSPLRVAAEQAAKRLVNERALALLGDPDSSFSIDGTTVLWGQVPLATLERGPRALQPTVRARHLALVAEGLQAAVRARLRDVVEHAIRDITPSLHRRVRAELDPVSEQIVVAVEQGVGTVLRAEVEPLIERLDPAGLKRLARLDVRLGRHVLYLPSTLGPETRGLRHTLWRLQQGHAPDLPEPSRVAVPAVGDPRFWWGLGFPVVGGLAVRADVLERVFAEARRAGRDGPFALPGSIPSWLGVDKVSSGRVLAGLGFQVVDLGGEIRVVASRTLYEGGRGRGRRP